MGQRLGSRRGVVVSILGHSTVRQTEDYFNDFDEEAVNAVFDKIEGSATGS